LIQKANIVVVVQISIFFQWQSKVVTSVDPSLPLFYLNVYNVELVLVLNITDLLLARC
jgi:ABC-type molybdate transport system permease subunit